MMYKNYHFYKVFFPYARNNIKVFWVGDSRGKKGVTPFLIAEFEKSFIDNQESREWDFHYFRTGNISQISSVCGPYIVCLVWFILLNYWPIFHKILPCSSSFYSFCCCLFTSFSPSWNGWCVQIRWHRALPQSALPTITQAKFKDLKFQGTQWKQTRNYIHF